MLDWEMATLKQRLNLQPGEIRIHAFESDEASIAELPGEYEEFLESPDSCNPESRRL